MYFSLRHNFLSCQIFIIHNFYIFATGSECLMTGNVVQYSSAHKTFQHNSADDWKYMALWAALALAENGDNECTYTYYVMYVITGIFKKYCPLGSPDPPVYRFIVVVEMIHI